MNVVARFLVEDSGSTAVEYGLIAALLAVGIITAATAVSGSLSGVFGQFSTKLNASVT